MTVPEIIELIRPLPAREKQQVLESLWNEFQNELEAYDPDLTPEQLAELKLTPEQIAELDRRAERALAHPERCRPLDDVVADIEKRFRAKG